MRGNGEGKTRKGKWESGGESRREAEKRFVPQNLTLVSAPDRLKATKTGDGERRTKESLLTRLKHTAGV